MPKKTPASDREKFPPVAIKYIFNDDYNPVYTNGAYGGVTASGEIVANFYFERHALPKKEMLYSDKQECVPEDLKNSAVRVVQTGIILSVESAKQLADWLYTNIDKANKLAQQTKVLEDEKK